MLLDDGNWGEHAVGHAVVVRDGAGTASHAVPAGTCAIMITHKSGDPLAAATSTVIPVRKYDTFRRSQGAWAHRARGVAVAAQLHCCS